MKIFITGITGYLGHQLALRLASENHEVKALVRDVNSKKIPKHKNIVPIKGDLCDYESINGAIEDCKYVFHLAAFTDLTCSKINDFYNTNVVGTDNVMKAALNNNVQNVVYTSTLSVFGPALYHVPITEHQPRLTSFTNDYELTKTMSEEVIMKYVQQGLSCSILNVSRVYGPGLKTYSNGVNKIISKIMEDRILFVPSNLEVEANYVYIQDVINAQICAINHGKSGEKYIIGGENVDYSSLFNTIRNITKSNIRIVKINYNIVRSLFNLYSKLCNIIGLRNSVTPKVLDSLFTNRSASSEKAMCELDYKITPLKVGLEKTVEHLKSQQS